MILTKYGRLRGSHSGNLHNDQKALPNEKKYRQKEETNDKA